MPFTPKYILITSIQKAIRDIAEKHNKTTYHETPREYFDLLDSMAKYAGASAVRWDGNQPDAYQFDGQWWGNLWNGANRNDDFVSWIEPEEESKQ